MKNYLAVYHTDIGIKKNTNQDSVLLTAIGKDHEEILLAVICDGMGGMAKGELASATVIRAFAEWFQKKYINDTEKYNLDKIRMQWMMLLSACNEKLVAHGKSTSLQLGTTASVVLILPDGKYVFCHVGDSRIYHMGVNMKQLTKDHTFIAREIERGNMTPEQAALDSRKNVLLQCIGVNDFFEPQFGEGNICNGEAFLLCSDGFRHMISQEEIMSRLAPALGNDEMRIREELRQLTEMNKQRNETDNITAVYVKKIG